MKALVVGLGSIGRRHLSNLRRLVPDADITVWRQHAQPTRSDVPVEGADRVVYSLEAALASHPSIAIIANPAPFHVQTGLQLARQGVSLLIEKPFSNALDGVDDLISLCHASGLTLMIGYNLRFNSSLRAMRQLALDGRVGEILSVIAEVGQYLPDWRPGSDYAQGVSAQKGLGGGAILELSHELDYVRWLAGDICAVSAQSAVLGDLKMDAENVADITLRFASGATGSVHLDMLQRAPVRTCKLIGSEGTLVWDGVAGTVRLFSASAKQWQEPALSHSQDRNDTYMVELRHFMDCVDTGSAPLITGEDGLYALKVALAAGESASSQRTINL